MKLIKTVLWLVLVVSTVSVMFVLGSETELINRYLLILVCGVASLVSVAGLTIIARREEIAAVKEFARYWDKLAPNGKRLMCWAVELSEEEARSRWNWLHHEKQWSLFHCQCRIDRLGRIWNRKDTKWRRRLLAQIPTFGEHFSQSAWGDLPFFRPSTTIKALTKRERGGSNPPLLIKNFPFRYLVFSICHPSTR